FSGASDPALRKITKLLHAEKKYSARLDQRVKKILGLKFDAALSRKAPADVKLLHARLHTSESRVLRRKAFEQSVTVVRNVNDALPVATLEGKEFTCIIAGDSTHKGDIFQRIVRKYVPANPVVVNDVAPVVDL